MHDALYFHTSVAQFRVYITIGQPGSQGCVAYFPLITLEGGISSYLVQRTPGASKR